MRELVRVENPRWDNIEEKNRFTGRFIYDDGTELVLSVAADTNNSEYNDFLRVSSIEDIDANTQRIRDQMAAMREQDTAIRSDRDAQKKANTLFNAKIEAFEIPEVQAASTEQKARIRKATTSVEVVAIAASIIMAAANAGTSTK